MLVLLEVWPFLRELLHVLVPAARQCLDVPRPPRDVDVFEVINEGASPREVLMVQDGEKRAPGLAQSLARPSWSVGHRAHEILEREVEVAVVARQHQAALLREVPVAELVRELAHRPGVNRRVAVDREWAHLCPQRAVARETEFLALGRASLLELSSECGSPVELSDQLVDLPSHRAVCCGPEQAPEKRSDGHQGYQD